MRFDITDLRLFRHIAETGSITHGAERSHLALASASARIRGMEEMLDVPLLQRGRRGVRLTDAGRSLLDHARIVLQQVDTMRGELSAYSRGLKGSVRVLANTAALSEHLPRLLADFLAANPTIDLDLEDRESPAIAAAVAAGDADIGIASQAALAAGLESHPFRPDRLVLIAPAGPAGLPKAQQQSHHAAAFTPSNQRHIASKLLSSVRAISAGPAPAGGFR